MLKKFTIIVIMFIFLNLAKVRVESKNMKVFGTSADSRNGLRLTRINVKQSQEIEKVYETDRYENSDDYRNQQSGIGKFWPTKDIPPESSSIQKNDYSNRGNRKFLGRKRTSSAHKKKQNKHIPKRKPKFENDSKTTRKDTKDRKFEKEKLKESNNTFKRRKKGNSAMTRPTIPSNIIERIKSGNKFNSNFSESLAHKVTKRNRFRTMSEEMKSNQKQKTVQNERNNTPSKLSPLNVNFKSKNGKLNSDGKSKIKAPKPMTGKMKEDLKLSRFNNQRHSKLELLGATKKTKQKSTNFKNEGQKTEIPLGRTRFSLKITTKTIQGIKTSNGEKRNEDMNVADIINSFIRLPLHIQKRVLDQVLLRQRNFSTLSDTVTLPGELSTISFDLSEKYSTTSIPPKIYSITSVDLPAIYTTAPVLPKAYRAIPVDSSTAYTTTSVLPKAHRATPEDSFTAYITTPVLPKAYRAMPVDIPIAYSTTSMLPKVYLTTSVDFPDVHTNTSVFPKAHNTALVDLPESYNTTSVLSKAYSTTSIDLPEANDNSETYSTESEEFPESSMTTSFDLSEVYSIGSEDASEAYSTPSLDLSEEYGTSSVGSTDDNLEVSISEEYVSQMYKKRNPSERPDEKKIKSEMLKEYYETYSMPPLADDSAGSLDIHSIPEEKSVRRRSSTQQENRQNFHSIQSAHIPKIRMKKNEGHFPNSDITNVAGTLYNYFALLPQNKKRGIRNDIPSKVKSFFDEISKPSTRNLKKVSPARNLENSLAPLLVTLKSREIEVVTDNDLIRTKESYDSDYDETSASEVMDTLGDLNKEFAM